ncbi:MAG: DUF2461 domain-containing protein [Niabella sp.]
MLQPSTLQFLSNLKKNNNKPWFDANRPAYEAAREDFIYFIQTVLDKFSKTEPSLLHLQAKSCLFRINRDVRFSKDKSPYKTNFGANINGDGKKAVTAGYYFHLEPGNSFIGGGMWMPMPPELHKVRQEIDYNFSAFKKLIKASGFVKTYGKLAEEEGTILVRVPKGYNPENPAAEYLKYKSFVAIAPVQDEALTSKQLLAQTVKAYEALRPLTLFLNEAIQ